MAESCTYENPKHNPIPIRVFVPFLTTRQNGRDYPQSRIDYSFNPLRNSSPSLSSISITSTCDTRVNPPVVAPPKAADTAKCRAERDCCCRRQGYVVEGTVETSKECRPDKHSERQTSRGSQATGNRQQEEGISCNQSRWLLRRSIHTQDDQDSSPFISLDPSESSIRARLSVCMPISFASH